MILKVFKENIIYTSDKKPEDNNELKNSYYRYSKKIVVYSCKFEPTTFGSILINTPNSNTTLELYPNSITHVIHDLIPLK